jgi:hypothetical protein
VVAEVQALQFVSFSVKYVDGRVLLVAERLSEVLFVKELFVLEMLIAFFAFISLLLLALILEEWSELLNWWNFADENDPLAVRRPGQATKHSVIVNLCKLIINLQRRNKALVRSPHLDVKFLIASLRVLAFLEAYAHFAVFGLPRLRQKDLAGSWLGWDCVEKHRTDGAIVLFLQKICRLRAHFTEPLKVGLSDVQHNFGSIRLPL